MSAIFGSFKAISDGLMTISSYFAQQQASASQPSGQPSFSAQNPPVHSPAITQPSATTSATFATPSATTSTGVTHSGTYNATVSNFQHNPLSHRVPSSGLVPNTSNNGSNAGFLSSGGPMNSNVTNQGFQNFINGTTPPVPLQHVYQAQDDTYNPRQVISIGLPLGYEVDEKIKQLIWDDKYVELSLLTNADQDDDYDLQFNPKVGSIHFKHKQKSIKSIVQWCDIMYTYQAIMMEDEVRAKDVPLFLNYIKDVRGICDEGWDWAFYDEQYRKYRGGCSNPEPWSVHRLDLYNTARRRALNQQRALFYQQPYGQNAINRRQSNFGNYGSLDAQAVISGIPKGFCFAFHSPTTRCTRLRCTFNHLCYMCTKAEHPGFLCRMTRPQMNSNNAFAYGQTNWSPRNLGVHYQPQSGFRAQAPAAQATTGQQFRTYNPSNAFRPAVASSNARQPSPS